MSQLVERFNQRGLAALLIATWARAQRDLYAGTAGMHRARVGSGPPTERGSDGDVVADDLRNALRKQALPEVGASTVREVLYEAGYRFGKTRTWCPTGTALRVRKAGTVTVKDPKAGEKKT